MNNNNKRNFNVYFLVILGLMFLAAWMFRGLSGQETDYTRGELTKDLGSGNVIEAIMQPNKETPTGIVRVFLKSGEEKTLYVTDIQEMEEELIANGLDPQVRDIPRENWFMTSIFPILLVLVVGVFFFVMMNA